MHRILRWKTNKNASLSFRAFDGYEDCVSGEKDKPRQKMKTLGFIDNFTLNQSNSFDLYLIFCKTLLV